MSDKVESMSDEELESKMSELGNKIREDVDELVERTNEMLCEYGLRCRMEILIEEDTDEDDRAES